MYVAGFKISAKNNLGFLIQSVDWAGEKAMNQDKGTNISKLWLE